MLVSAVYMYLYVKRRPTSSNYPAHIQKALTVKQGNRKVLLSLNEIIWIAAEDYYVRIHTKRGDFLDRIPLKVILGKLPESVFLRVHRSSAVNISAISEFRSISGYKAELLMKDGSTCPVSKTYFKPLKAKLASRSI
jgi:DNA-binding LytR/AlgR family response regulator